MTNVGLLDAPDGPRNGFEANFHVWDSSLCVCSDCSRAMNVAQNGILCTPVTWSTSRLLLMHPVQSPVPPEENTPPDWLLLSLGSPIPSIPHFYYLLNYKLFWAPEIILLNVTTTEWQQILYVLYSFNAFKSVFEIFSLPFTFHQRIFCAAAVASA